MTGIGEVAGWVAVVVVGSVFVIAGGAKLAAGERWIADARALGVDRPVAVGVPPVEIVTGAGILSGVLTPWPAVVAASMLVAFTALIVWNLAGGKHPPCACFGSWSARPLSRWHVGRNVALLALTVVAIVR